MSAVCVKMHAVHVFDCKNAVKKKKIENCFYLIFIEFTDHLKSNIFFFKVFSCFDIYIEY